MRGKACSTEFMRKFARLVDDGLTTAELCGLYCIGERQIQELKSALTIQRSVEASISSPINLQPSHYREIARAPEAMQPAIAQQAAGAGQTVQQVIHAVRDAKREALRAENRKLVEAAPPAVAVCQNGHRYSTIAIDPPWDWGDEGDLDQFGRARPPYDTMPLEEIRLLPLDRLAMPDAHLYLWITNRSLPKGFSLLDAWGFRYITALAWVKPSFGMGNYFRGSTELVLFGVKGSLPLLRRDAPTHFAAPRPGPHSAKPDAFFELVETCSPGPWLEMFARSRRPGWVSWGAEISDATLL